MCSKSAVLVTINRDKEKGKAYKVTPRNQGKGTLSFIILYYIHRRRNKPGISEEVEGGDGNGD